MSSGVATVIVVATFIVVATVIVVVTFIVVASVVVAIFVVAIFVASVIVASVVELSLSFAVVNFCRCTPQQHQIMSFEAMVNPLLNRKYSQVLLYYYKPIIDFYIPFLILLLFY